MAKKKQLNKVSVFNKFLFKPAESYRFWNLITGNDLARNFLFKKIVDQNRREEILQHFRSVLALQRRERLGFKITGSSRLEYLHSLFPDAKFIWIEIEPLSNIGSLMNGGFYQN